MIGGLASIQARVLQLQNMVGQNPSVQLAQRAAQTGGAGALSALGTGSAGDAAAMGTMNAGTSGARFDELIEQLKRAADDTPGARTRGGDGTSTADRVIATAKKYLGIPYLWGGTDPKKGLDCSGLTQLVYKQVGVDLPRVSRDQAKVGRAVGSLDDARPGDLLFFHSPVSHVGIYLGNGKMLDAPKTGDVVKIQKVWAKPTHIRRVLPAGSWDAATSAASSASTASAGTAVSAGSAVSGKAARAGGLSGPYADLFTAAGRKYGVDPALLSAVAKNESSYRPDAVSHAGARGLMQLMPATARGLGVNAFDPKQAVDGAARLLSGYLDDYDGNVKLALAAYNAGPGAVKRYGGVPPYRETQNYVTRVTSTWKDLR